MSRIVLALFSLLCFVGYAEETTTTVAPKPTFTADKIEDNSFLIEEAYNQEPGVIQHIQTFNYKNDRTWDYTFTEEWPLGGRAHQLSLTLSMAQAVPTADTVHMGDTLVNYRYQLIEREGVLMAPRLSAVVPTGNALQGTGRGGVGAQFNLPLTVELTDRWVTHWNAGFTVIPSAKSGELNGDYFAGNFGASVIYAVQPKWNLMLEVFGTTGRFNGANNGPAELETSLYVNPGTRASLKIGDLDVVPGFSVPIGVGPSAGDLGAFAYLSLEHQAF